MARSLEQPPLIATACLPQGPSPLCEAARLDRNPALRRRWPGMSQAQGHDDQRARARHAHGAQLDCRSLALPRPLLVPGPRGVLHLAADHIAPPSGGEDLLARSIVADLPIVQVNRLLGTLAY